MKKIVPLAIAGILLAGCGMNQSQNTANQITAGDLQHHNFVLVSVDGQSPKNQQGNMPNIEFGEKMHISGAMCNRFMGQGELKDSVLTVEALAGTRMMCNDSQLNQWDTLIGEVLASGAKVTLNKGELTLSNGSHTLIYTSRDWVS
ncbi:heat shock protein HslJ [Yersinia nurmii]|uniref:Heat shock protein HslJ n=1 Tax=Yersinia nurmii TaxID=685706 RepID=A0AAW7JXA5_9GAMM|nr:heat shock protein HslJ [Yersinia nurmii]MDN0087373.1 heat shock protein HslJ [Yersinia nurmii]CNE93074.1 heat-inducible protein [Yersinia nurmii]